MLADEQKNAFGEFYKSARHNGVLDEKTTVMIHAATAMALGCYPCMEYYFDQAEKLNITKEELGAVQAIVMAVSAGKVMAQVQEVRGES